LHLRLLVLDAVGDRGQVSELVPVAMRGDLPGALARSTRLGDVADGRVPNGVDRRACEVAGDDLLPTTTLRRRRDELADRGRGRGINPCPPWSPWGHGNARTR
jgi:hypothetical protein